MPEHVGEIEKGHDHGHAIHFVVNNITHETRDHTLRVKEILRIAGFTSTDYTLVLESKPGEALSPESEIHLHDGERFLALRKTNTVSELGGIKDLEAFFTEKPDFKVGYAKGNNGDNLVLRDVVIPAGPLAGKVCDIALQSNASSPFMPHPAFHTKPALVAMGTNGTQAGQISPDWQYWSRQWPKPPLSGEEVWSWILTALTQAII